MGFGDIIRHRVAPAMAEVGKHLDEFGKNQLAPAIGEVGKHLDELGENQLRPATDQVGKQLHNFGEHQLGPAVGNVGKQLYRFERNNLNPLIKNVGKRIYQINEERCITQRISTYVETTIKKRPEAVALFGVGLACAVAPTIITAPLYLVLGMSGAGPIAGGAVSVLQSSAIAPAAVAIVQSAAMGGYGLVIVDSVVRVLSVGSMLLSVVRAAKIRKRVKYGKSV